MASFYLDNSLSIGRTPIVNPRIQLTIAAWSARGVE